ncbi:hypothetical protein C8F04DRAFT_922409, partial [Mycena alexandri]
EDLAQETSSWIFFAAQHVNANDAFLHYTSPRLLRDSKDDVEEITNHFNRVFLDLKNARQKDALELSKKL